MLWPIILMAVGVCIYWDWQEHAPEKVCAKLWEEPKSIPLSASIRKYEIQEERIAS